MASFDSVNLLSKIGEGSYASVYKARWKKDVVAMKKFHSFEDGLDESTIMEVFLLSTLKHDNIVTFLGAGSTCGSFYILIEYMESDLAALINELKPKQTQTLFIISEILKGVEYIHGINVSHRDLKPSNILFSAPNIVKIADFGFGKVHNKWIEKHSYPVQTLYYRAPEVFLAHIRGEYDLKIDIWSVGAILGEMLIGSPLFPADTEINLVKMHFKVLGMPTNVEGLFRVPISFQELSKKYSSNNNLHKYVHAGDGIIKILSNMLNFDSQKRPTAKKCLDLIEQFTQSTNTGTL